jgi:hypothetical protein
MKFSNLVFGLLVSFSFSVASAHHCHSDILCPGDKIVSSGSHPGVVIGINQYSDKVSMQYENSNYRNANFDSNEIYVTQKCLR